MRIWTKARRLLSALMTMAALATSRTLTPNQQARRHRILDAARALVAKHGYDGMIMRDVATEAQVSPTTLYNLYNTKDELLLEALRDSISDAWDRTSAVAPELGFDRLMTQLTHSVNQTKENAEYAQAITQALLRASAGDQLVDNLIKRSARAVHVSLQAMHDEKQLKPKINLEELAIGMVGAFWSNYMLWSKGVIELGQLEEKLRRGYLSFLLPTAQGRLKQDISQLLDELVI